MDLPCRHSFEATEQDGPQNGRIAMPETDLLHINRWCRERVPEHLWDQVRVEAELADRHVTIIETRPPWDGQGDWTRFPVARLRYTVKTGQWSIYWRDRNMKFHEYTRKRPTKNVQALLDYIGSHQDPIFWGESPNASCRQSAGSLPTEHQRRYLLSRRPLPV